MKLGAKAENPLEQVALAVGIVPTPLLDTIVALLLARSVMVGVKLGLFEALSGEPLPAAEVAARCATDRYATEKLLGALARLLWSGIRSPSRCFSTQCAL